MHKHLLQAFRDIPPGDAVDQVEADLVVLSAEAVHTKKVDCNLLAEFCTAPGRFINPCSHIYMPSKVLPPL